MIGVAVVLVAALAVVVGVPRAIRKAPVECRHCGRLIDADQWDVHIGGCGPVPGGCPPSPGTVLARQVHPTRGLSDDVCRRICTELEGQFVEDDTARRTTLNRNQDET